jgi:hypothetical protein
LLNKRLISRLLVKSVKKESNPAAAARLLRAVRSAERLDITLVRIRKTPKILLNLPC